MLRGRKIVVVNLLCAEKALCVVKSFRLRRKIVQQTCYVVVKSLLGSKKFGLTKLLRLNKTC